MSALSAMEFDFSRVTYRKPRRFQSPEIARFIGLDTEAYKNGYPFLFCTSLGESFDLSGMPARLFDPQYEGCAFVCFNLQYDSGALLRHIPPERLQRLKDNGEVRWKGVLYRYIEHKYLMLRRKGQIREIWDIAQYYEMSLDKAAKRYLGVEGKLTLETKAFSPEYVDAHRAEIIRYCIRDCELTADLAEFFKRKLNEFGVSCTRLYSSASLSYDYFKSKGPIVNVWHLWKSCRSMLEFACEAYQGGKFEITSRGAFKGYEYDIVSAYPYEIQNLIDISHGKVVRVKRYTPDAVYSFYRVWMKNRTRAPMPHGVKQGNVQVFPLGEFSCTITGPEYEYMTRQGMDVTILDGRALYVDALTYPYRATVMELYKMKDYYKGKDDALYNVSKRMLNGFYGKFLQLVETPTGSLRAGAGWNPIYAAYITANTRLRVCQFQAKYPGQCIAVHTDSIMMLSPLPESELSSDLGGLKLELTGEGLLLMCGMYDMGPKTKYRGLEFRRDMTWRKLLTENPAASKITYPQLRVISWTQAIAWGKPQLINVFQDFPKVIDLNADSKRNWPGRTTARKLLRGLESSRPRVIIQKKGEK